MPFRKKSIAEKTVGKKIKNNFWKISKLTGFFLAGTVFFVPKFFLRKIRQKKEKSKKSKLKILFVFIFIIFAVLVGFFWTISKNLSAGKKIFFALGAELPRDKNNFFNILLLGVGGAEMHAEKGHKLTDAILIASVDIDGKNLVMLSVPRDFYVETDFSSGRINEVVRDSSAIFLSNLKNRPENIEKMKKLSGEELKKFIWGLEEKCDEMARGVLRKKIEEIFQIEIHRVAQINFSGFKETVDVIGGIDVLVEKKIDDPYYPDEEWGFSPFFLPVGDSHLNGETALKFVRSRHDSSDFDRAKRQQKVLTAIKEKASQINILRSPTKIKEILNILRENFLTNLSWREIISLAEFADSLPRENIFSYNLNDDPSSTGGFLVTPSRELYNGAFVLVPFLNLTDDKYARLRSFSKIIFVNRGLAAINPPHIEILNGTKIPGLARSLKNHLERFGFSVTKIDDAENLEKTTRVEFFDSEKNREIVEVFSKFLKLQISPNQDLLPQEFKIIIGKDYDGFLKIPEF